MQVTINGSVNGGVCLTFPGGFRVWVDFCPDFKTRLWEYIPESDWENIKKNTALFPPDVVFFTHCHPDHFSLERTEEILRTCPGTKVYAPLGEVFSASKCGFLSADSLPCEKVSGDEATETVGKLTIRFLRSTHSGKEYSNISHYSLFLTYEGKTVFISGDAALSDETLAERLEFLHTDLAVMNFPWASLHSGRETVETSIQPSHVYLVHLPAENEDVFGYRKAAENGAELLNVPDVRLMLSRFSEEVFTL